MSMWFYGRKSLWGPILSILDTAPWVAIAVLTRVPFVGAFEFILLGFSIRTLWLWVLDLRKKGASAA